MNGIAWPRTLAEHCTYVRTANARIDEVRRAPGVSPPVPDVTAHVRVVYAIVSGSRAGTSVFAAWLRHQPGAAHLPGEIGPGPFQSLEQKIGLSNFGPKLSI
jgi:hypothetical protein